MTYIEEILGLIAAASIAVGATILSLLDAGVIQ